MKWLGWLFGGHTRKTDARRAAFAGKETLIGALDIEYVNALGVRSERYIEAKSLSGKNGKLLLYGWCEQRQALRSFRVDRIKALTDGQTGEIIRPENIRNWLIDRALR